jgi:hypothetical protein
VTWSKLLRQAQFKGTGQHRCSQAEQTGCETFRSQGRKHQLCFWGRPVVVGKPVESPVNASRHALCMHGCARKAIQLRRAPPNSPNIFIPIRQHTKVWAVSTNMMGTMKACQRWMLCWALVHTHEPHLCVHNVAPHLQLLLHTCRTVRGEWRCL